MKSRRSLTGSSFFWLANNWRCQIQRQKKTGGKAVGAAARLTTITDSVTNSNTAALHGALKLLYTHNELLIAADQANRVILNWQTYRADSTPWYGTSKVTHLD
jgi:hypothetical protein